MLINKRADGALYYLNNEVKCAVGKGIAYVYRKMDWINPELPHGLLVFRKDFVETNPEAVKKIISAYMKRLKYETEESTQQPVAQYKRSGFQKALYFQGLDLPKYDYPPFVRLDLLNEMQELLLKYKYIDKRVDLEKFINNDFVEEVYKELE